MTFAEGIEGGYVPADVDMPTRLAAFACERYGLRFLIEFGYGNAVQKAREIRREHIANRAQLFQPGGAK